MLPQVAPFRDAAGQMPGYQARVAALVRGYPHMPSLRAADQVALRTWMDQVAGPQLAAAARGDFLVAIDTATSDTAASDKPATGRLRVSAGSAGG